jgi:hypothetical protein
MPFILPLVPLEILQWIEVPQGGFIIFKAMVQELLNIEQFCH